MSEDVHFGVTLPQIKRTWDEAKSAAVEFDRLGYDSVWVCDHLYGIPAPENPILEAWTELTAVAAVTERVQIGTLVTPPLFRNPALLAKQIATIDHISGGRVIAGFGAGWFQDEFEGYGIEFPPVRDRLAALDEMVELMTRMWTEDEVTFDGRWAKAKAVRCAPKPEAKVPVLIGGSGEKILMGIAARHADIYNNTAVSQPLLAQKVEALHRRCDDVGRNPDEIRVSQQCTVVISPDEATAKEDLAKASRIFGGHLGDAIEEHGIWGSPDQVIDRIEAHRAKGCSMFFIEFFGRDTKEPARLFADTVLAHYR